MKPLLVSREEEIKKKPIKEYQILDNRDFWGMNSGVTDNPIRLEEEEETLWYIKTTL